MLACNVVTWWYRGKVWKTNPNQGIEFINFTISVLEFNIAPAIDSRPITLRVILIWLLLIAMLAVPLLEQPASSVMNYHERFQWMLRLLERNKILAPQAEI